MCVALAAAVLSAVPRLIYGTFYYAGDTLESFVPSWHRIGTELRAGNWLMVNPDAWIGGNYAGEAAYGLYNPVNLANYILTSLIEDLSVASWAVMAQFLALFALSTYLLCREYGARRIPSIVVALALPYSGFTLFYEAGGWPSGMMAVAWVTLFWWSALRLSRGRANPFVTFVIGALTISMGNPYAALGAVIVLFGLAVSVIIDRNFRRLAVLIITGACAGTAAALTYLPLFLSVDVTTRAGSTGISNDTFLQPQISALGAMSSPSHLPVIMTFGGPIEVLPSLYLAWFVVPLLPWLRWDRIATIVRTPRLRAAGLRPLISLAVITGIYFLFTFGPSNIGMFRWPIRLIEYLYLGVMVAFALTLSMGIARTAVRARALASGALIFLGFYLAFSATPQFTLRHLIFAVTIVALSAAAYVAWQRARDRGLAVVLVAGTVVITAGQVYSLTRDIAPGAIAHPASTTVLADATANYQGTVLQLADRNLTPDDQITSGQILFGNEILASPVEASINAYTGIGFTMFQEALCLDYRASTCPELFDYLWEPVNDDIDIPIIDYLRVSTLILQHELRPDLADSPAPDGWRIADRDDIRTIFEREQSLALPGTVSYASPGVDVVSAQRDDNGTRETVTVDGTGGTISFARLAWPGYFATIDGETVPAPAGWHGLLEITVPTGAHEVVIDFRPPKQRLSMAAFGVATIVMMAVGTYSAISRRRTDA
ncbi:MAG: hypothetical protein GX542_01795 [Rhodococcus sp.]|nr:hypothetical protein [Rhodococcus sp. (in: high G+C Gram-positive bacteria)]